MAREVRPRPGGEDASTRKEESGVRAVGWGRDVPLSLPSGLGTWRTGAGHSATCHSTQDPSCGPGRPSRCSSRPRPRSLTSLSPRIFPACALIGPPHERPLASSPASWHCCPLHPALSPGTPFTPSSGRHAASLWLLEIYSWARIPVEIKRATPPPHTHTSPSTLPGV